MLSFLSSILLLPLLSFKASISECTKVMPPSVVANQNVMRLKEPFVLEYLLF